MMSLSSEVEIPESAAPGNFMSSGYMLRCIIDLLTGKRVICSIFIHSGAEQGGIDIDIRISE